MNIILNNSSMVPIYVQLVSQIKASVIDGSLKTGDALPSVRVMAAELRISALTVKKAYDKLEEEGFAVTVHGKGSFISAGDVPLDRESRKLEAEKQLDKAVAGLKTIGMTADDIRALIEIILEDQG